MIDIQELKIWAEDEKEKAKKHYFRTMEMMKYDLASIYKQKRRAFSLILDAVELLLKNDGSNQPQPPDFANTVLGEVPPVSVSESSKDNRAVEGETRLVGQNEQTEFCCPKCKKDDQTTWMDENVWFCHRCIMFF